MAYQQFDRNGNEITPQDLQNKTQWCKDGERIEQAFVGRYGESLGLIINPKKATDPYAPDLLKDGEFLADLKTQNTPFFKAGSLYKIDPTYAVVFNGKDFDRYKQYYPDIIIYFWVEWHSVKFLMNGRTTEVEYLNGVWSIPFSKLSELIQTAPAHEYQQRVNDTKGNAKYSYVLDIRNPAFTKVI